MKAAWRRWVAAALCVLALAGRGDDELDIARRALADGLWAVAEKHARAALETGGDPDGARLVILEAVANAGRAGDLMPLLDGWTDARGDAFRYWRAWALAQTGKTGAARAVLSAPFVDAAYTARALRLAAHLAAADGDRAAVEEKFSAAAQALGTNAAARVANAVDWARARAGFGDDKGALAALTADRATEAAGAAGDEARVLAADLAERLGDAARARALRETVVAAGTNAAERASVEAACRLAETALDADDAAAARAWASNAVARATQPADVRRAGFCLGFADLRAPDTRAAGAARIAALLRRWPDAPEARETHVRFADALLAAGDAAGAERAYADLLQAYPEHALDARVLTGRGWAYLKLGRRTEAVGAFARAAQVATNVEDRARAVYKQADALLEDGRFDEAAAAYARVDGASALAAQARFQQADAVARAGRTDDAIALFRALAAAPDATSTSGEQNTPGASGGIAVAAALREAALETSAGRPERAIEIYGRLLAGAVGALDDDRRVEALLGRGRALYGAYRFAEAEADFAAVAKARPARAAEMRFWTALCLYGAGRDNEAEAAARALLAEAPDGPLRADLLLWLAKYDYGRRDYAAAREAFASCATNRFLSDGRRIEALGRAARCCAALGDQAGVMAFAARATTNAVAVRALASVTRETPAVAEAFVLQGAALMELARFDEAVLVLEKAMRPGVPPDLTRRAALLKADCLFAMGADDDRRYGQAIEAYRAALRDEGLSPSARIAASFKIGRALEKLRRTAEADDQYYVHVVMAFCDGLRENTWFDGDARAFFARAAFILADRCEARGEARQAARILEHLVKTGVPAADEARRRIGRLNGKGGAW